MFIYNDQNCMIENLLRVYYVNGETLENICSYLPLTAVTVGNYSMACRFAKKKYAKQRLGCLACSFSCVVGCANAKCGKCSLLL